MLSQWKAKITCSPLEWEEIEASAQRMYQTQPYINIDGDYQGGGRKEIIVQLTTSEGSIYM